ncbi:MAG: hypothetical protein OXU40_09140 [Nitrospira sp.]|nr:hypothetical protein [Nitrospira sp.]
MLQSIQSDTIRTIVGAGEPGYAGDDGPATAALLNEPKHLAFDATDNLYIADSENHLVRKVDARTGIITTIAGVYVQADPPPGPAGPAGDPSLRHSCERRNDDDPLADPVDVSAQAYVQKPDLSGMVRCLSGAAANSSRFSGDGGLATRAVLNFPSAVAVAEDGTVYIADTWNHRIRRVDPGTGIISTIAGTGQAKWSGDHGPAARAALNEPVALALDGRHALYIADQSNNRIRKIDLTSGEITTVAGTGESAYNGDGAPGPDTALAGPSGLAVDHEGNVYIADTFSSRIRLLDRQTGVVEAVVGGTGQFQLIPGENESSPSLSRPYAIALHPDGRLFITDNDNHVIRVWNLRTRAMSLLAGSGQAGYAGDGLHPAQGRLNYPFGVALDSRGQVYVADTFNHCIRVIGMPPAPRQSQRNCAPGSLRAQE